MRATANNVPTRNFVVVLLRTHFNAGVANKLSATAVEDPAIGFIHVFPFGKPRSRSGSRGWPTRNRPDGGLFYTNVAVSEARKASRKIISRTEKGAVRNSNIRLIAILSFRLFTRADDSAKVAATLSILMNC